MDFNQLAGGRHPDAVRRILGEDIVLSGVSPELQTNIVLENDRVENWYPQGVIPWSAIRTVAAGAALNSGAAILNPAGSGVLCVIEAYLVDTVNFLIGKPESPPTILGETGGQVAVAVMDTRALQSPIPIVTDGFQRGAVPNNCWGFNVANSQNPFRVVLAPNGQVIFWNSTQNAAINLSVRGYIRKLKPEELSA